MMFKSNRAGLAVASALFIFSTGCITIGGMRSGGCGPRVWTEATEQLNIDSSGLAEFQIRSHNGEVSYAGESDAGQISVSARKRGGGRTQEDAELALDNIEVYVESKGAGVQRLGWRWKTSKRSNWGGDVSFTVTGPSRMSLDVQTHNGKLALNKIDGKIRAVTHNGRVDVQASGESLYAHSHNGGVSADFNGGSVNIETHNGPIVAELRAAGPVGGKIRTHNGSVRVGFGREAAAIVSCRTHNGGIRSELPGPVDATRTRLRATVGEGGADLAVTTHNGGIKLQPTAG